MIAIEQHGDAFGTENEIANVVMRTQGFALTTVLRAMERRTDGYLLKEIG